MGAGLCNRDYPACASVGKRSSISPAAHRASARSTSNVTRPSLQTEPRRPAHHGAHRLRVPGKINRLAERQLGVKVDALPITPRRLRTLIREAQAAVA